MKTTLKDKLSKTLFHGTLMDRAENIREAGIDFTKLGDKADFAKGFYLTDSYALAENTAILRYNQESMVKDNPAIQISIHNEEFLKSCIKYKGYDIIRLEKEDEHYE